MNKNIPACWNNDSNRIIETCALDVFVSSSHDSLPHQDMDSYPLPVGWLQGQENPLQMPVLYGNCDIRSVPRCAVC